jgi:hypothetical protein
MKSLDQIDAKLEKRIPISSLPFTISASGSYYLTGSLEFSATSGDAITITASDVTLDLNGFTLSSKDAVTGYAISATSFGLRNIAVKNGVITGTTTVTISGTVPNQTWTTTPGGFTSAFSGAGATSCQFSHLRLTGCRGASAISVGKGATIDHVIASSNGGYGINAPGATVTDCTASSKGGGISADNGSVTNSTANSNGSGGISASNGSITNCSAIGNHFVGIDAFHGHVTNSTAQSTDEVGISADGGSVTSCTSNSNGTHGIHASSGSVINSTANSNGSNGISASTGTVTNSTATSNGTNGILGTDGVVAFCKAGGNNTKNNGSLDINATGATRTGNNPTP